eukprot:182705-Chlamydomonas_euryale.AAC.16
MPWPEKRAMAAKCALDSQACWEDIKNLSTHKFQVGFMTRSSTDRGTECLKGHDFGRGLLTNSARLAGAPTVLAKLLPLSRGSACAATYEHGRDWPDIGNGVSHGVGNGADGARMFQVPKHMIIKGA